MLAKRHVLKEDWRRAHSMSPPALGIVSSGLARCTWPRKNGFSLNDLVLFQERLASIARSISTLLLEKVNVVLPA
ncbi:hypothetical protein, partial [Rhizobium redzepovicii]|uniref:hypothetical protein n=1 Tax=Rhizobium redzepovicii TaxID=2867518 RepID=UPI001C93576D